MSVSHIYYCQSDVLIRTCVSTSFSSSVCVEPLPVNSIFIISMMNDIKYISVLESTEIFKKILINTSKQKKLK